MVHFDLVSTPPPRPHIKSWLRAWSLLVLRVPPPSPVKGAAQNSPKSHYNLPITHFLSLFSVHDILIFGFFVMYCICMLICICNFTRNRPFARWCHLTTTTRILFVLPFIFKFGNPGEVWVTIGLVCRRKRTLKDYGCCSTIRSLCKWLIENDLARV